ncbi:hypothetical protein B0T17DRAFT_497144 [Bombardia bombarda]|uniref:Myosin class II heavy chain n=1 Tax=Bombardia bombarda TaxID=252184 RepID=A0AA39WI04_9PEZI|nr:hypothetical protein B0T17DRAFT_497144 [Bombardia bombarda]
MTSDERSTPDSTFDEPTSAVEASGTPTIQGDVGLDVLARGNGEHGMPATPPRVNIKRTLEATTPRLKRKVPWKGKNIMVLLPRDDDRGQPGKAPAPLTDSEVKDMMRSWEQLGYNVDGFDLQPPAGIFAPGEQSQSRGAWPDFDDLARERKQGNWTVLLPDLNAWKRYVDELNEAKLRALGVSFGDDDPTPASASPAPTLSRQPSVTHYPQLPFSPPVPTSSASSNQAMQGFPFPGQFVTSATQSPGIPAGVSPASFAGKYNPRASISGSSPHGWPPHLMLHQGHRAGSPSLANFSAMMSPPSPFSADGMSGQHGHQRHQSLQFSMLPHQFQPPARSSPRLQDLNEVEEEAPSKSPSKTPEPSLVRHNASNSLQREIDEAEYHLEEQMRSQFENDEDYSPHNDDGNTETIPVLSTAAHARDPSVQFAAQPPRFGGDVNGPILHHPRPHSRGHSLSQKYFTDDDVSNDAGFRPTLLDINTQANDESEVETNPSNLGTPIQALDFAKLLHQRSFSTQSNPWTDNESGKPTGGPHVHNPSHGSKASLSKLNVEAPEFKFNPSSTFRPAPFNFATNNFQPAVFNAGLSSATSGQFSLPAITSSKINVNAPMFSPGQTDFSFASSGPKFRPDAPAFTPHSLSNSITTGPLSGGESIKGGSAIFGNIDLNAAEIVMPTKKSKAVPIVQPESRQLKSPRPDEIHDGPDGRPVDESRIKRARANDTENSNVPLFAEQPTEEATPVPESISERVTEDEATPLEERSFDESNLGQADMTLSSTMVSEATDTKATVSPTATSPDQATMNWAPFEFESKSDIQSFAEAAPFGDDMSYLGHNKSLSATARVFVPGVPVWGTPAEEPTDEIVDTPIAAPNTESTTTHAEQAPEDDLAGELPEQAAEEAAPSPNETFAEEISHIAAVPKGLAASRYASPPPKPAGLAASRFASLPSPVQDDEVVEAEQIVSPLEADDADSEPTNASTEDQEPTFDDIDAIMRHLNQNPNMGVNKSVESPPRWHQPSPTRHISLAAVTSSSPLHLPPQGQFQSEAPSPSSRQYDVVHTEEAQPVLSTELDDPFVDRPKSPRSFNGPIHHLNGSESLPASDWDGVFSDDEQIKLESRVNFFDGHVNELVGGLLAARLGPLEQTLDTIKHKLAVGSRRAPSSRPDRRSMSADIRESDADDEDDDIPVPRRSMSPRRDRKMEQIRSAVLDAFSTQQRVQQKEVAAIAAPVSIDDSIVLKALAEMKEQFSQQPLPDIRGEELKSIIEEAIESRIPPAPQPASNNDEQVNELQARVLELEQRIRLEETKVETEITSRRAAEDRAAELNRELESAATKIEVEMMNNSALNQRIADLEGRVHHSEQQAEEEVQARRAAEDRLSEVQRLLRISSEEETRLREVIDEKEQKMKAAEATHSKNSMRLALLEAGQANSQQSQSEGQSRINVLEADLRDARLEARNLRAETDRLTEAAQRRGDDLTEALGENKAMHKLIDTLATQLEENERIRDNWRSKFVLLQEELAQTAHNITEENAQRAKKEQAMLARQEVLDARLQAEARTRERIETELERLEMGERQGMRAVAECKRLEALLSELRTENSKLQQSTLRFQAEFQEARESGAREVQRTRETMQAEVEDANHQVNVVRGELEDQMARFRSRLDQVKMDADTARARHEMLLEEAETSKRAELEELEQKQQNEIEDLQARYERQLSNTTEDAQRAEQNLLERLSISTSKSEYLQDRVAHLEERLEVAKEAALAAAQAAKSSVANSEPSVQPKATSHQMELPEKISPQALRESIMVLQEQLQEREHRIEELEQQASKVDPDAEIKISKRDDEIIWLRELLAVRHSDLQDIIAALGREDYDKNAVRDAAIRLKANLQMEEQERERAMNGGSAINLPNIAATIRDAATPRVAQAVGPLAAAWGNWRKGRDPGSFGSLGSVLSSPAPTSGSNSTPSRTSSSPNTFLGGLLTPPASGMRQTPPAASTQQPTAFSNTGRRFTAQDLANRPRGISGVSSGSKQEGKMPSAETPPRRSLPGPVTPPMMRPSAYDSDAQAEDFDDAGFFEED